MRTSLILTSLLVMMLTGCTRNNGDIGPIFGLWKLVGIEPQGEWKQAPDLNVENLYWGFQSSTVRMVTRKSQALIYESFGNWSISGSTLYLSFPDPEFPPRAEFGLPAETSLNILELSSGTLIVCATPIGATAPVVYRFEKW